MIKKGILVFILVILLSSIKTLEAQNYARAGNFETTLNHKLVGTNFEDTLLSFIEYDQVTISETKFKVKEKDAKKQQSQLEKEKVEGITQPRFFLFFGLIALIFPLTFFAKSYIEKIKLEAQNKLRKRLTRDIHDEVGRIINDLTSSNKEALENKSNPLLIERKLKQSINLGNRAMYSLKYLIWNLEDRETTLEQFEKEIFTFTKEAFLFHKISYQIKIIGFKESLILSPKIYSNLMMLYKEAIHNVIKHGKKEAVTIEWKYENKEFYLSIKNLILPLVNSHAPYFGIHRGLENMQKRSTLINGLVAFKKVNDIFELTFHLNERSPTKIEYSRNRSTINFPLKVKWLIKNINLLNQHY